MMLVASRRKNLEEAETDLLGLVNQVEEKENEHKAKMSEVADSNSHNKLVKAKHLWISWNSSAYTAILCWMDLG